MIPQALGIVRLSAFVILLLSKTSHAIDPGSLFNLAPGNTRGGCDDHLNEISLWLDESLILGTVGVQGLQVAQGKEEVARTGFDEKLYAERLTFAFFHLDSNSPSADWNFVFDRMESVRSWVNGDAGDPGGKKPWLFCGTAYLTRQDPSDPALNSQGRPLDGNPTIQSEFADELTDGKVPWWSEYNNHYYFGPEDSDRECENKLTTIAAADTSLPAPFLVFLCPGNMDLELTGGEAELGIATPKQGTFLWNMRPLSTSVFHELFHLVLGNDKTDDVTYSLPGIRNGVKDPDTVPLKKTLDVHNKEEVDAASPNTENETNLQMLRKNPDTYVYFALAYWCWTQTYQTGPDGKDQKALFPADTAEMIDWDSNFA